MKNLKLKGTSKVEVKALGITLTSSSTSEQIEAAIKQRPELSQFVEEVTVKTK